MSDIRLKQITIDPGTLDIKEGTVYIYDTTISSSALTGSVVTLGGISIASTNPATFPTSGGALTVKGGIAVGKNFIIDGDILQENTESALTLEGTSVPRLFVDTETNAQITLAPNGVNTSITVAEHDTTINSTKVSSGASNAAFVVVGGASIMSTENNTSFTNGGGSLTVGGGALVTKVLSVGEAVFLKGNGTTASLVLGPLDNNTSGNNASVIQSVNGSGFSSSLEFYTHPVATGTEGTIALIVDADQNALFHSATDSTGITEGSVATLGGLGVAKAVFVGGQVSVQDGADSTNASTGSINTLGGIGTVKSAYIGQDLNVLQNAKITGVVGVEETATRNNKLVLFQTSGNLSEGVEFTGMGVINVSDALYQVPASSDHIFRASGTDVLKITDTGGVQFKGNAQKYTISGNGIGTKSLSIQGNEASSAVSFELFTNDGDSSDNNTLKIFNEGTSTSIINTEYLTIGWNVSQQKHLIKTVKTGTGSLQAICIESGISGQVLLETNGSTSVGDSLDVAGLVAVNSTEPNSLTVLGGGSFAKDLYIGGGLNIIGAEFSVITTDTTRHNLIVTGDDNLGLTLQSENPTLDLQSVGTFGSTNTEAFSINSNTTATLITTTKSGTGENRPIVLGLGSQLYLETSGNIGINSSSPSTSLYVDGTCEISGNVTIGGLSINQIVASGTTQSINPTTGSVIGFGGLGIVKDVFIGGNVNILSTKPGSISTQGGITVEEGVDISGMLTAGSTLLGNSTVGSLFVSSVTDSPDSSTGSLTVKGGVGISKKLHVGQSINGHGNVNLVDTALHFQGSTAVDFFSIEKDTDDLSISRYNATGVFIDKCIKVSNTTGNLEVTKSATIQEVLTVNSVTETTSTQSGAIITLGGIGVGKSVIVGEAIEIRGTVESVDINTGALIVEGGAGVKKNLYVGGSTVISGDLVVNGITTTINSTVTELDDNLITVNSGASGSRDAGILFYRFQTENDTGLGDVVADTDSLEDTLPDQTAVTSTQIKLSTSASAVDEFYTGWYIMVTSGFSNNQVRKITAYTGATRIATVSAWTSQNPAISDTVNLYDKPFVGLFYNELDDLFELAGCIEDPGQSTVDVTKNIGLRLKGATLTSTTPTLSSTSGSIVSSGGLGIACTENAVSVTSGGSITTDGGAAIAKDLIVGGTLVVNGVGISKGINSITFTGANNQSSAVDVTGALIASGAYGADIFLATRTLATSDLFTNYHLRIINRSSSWEIVTSYVGDDSGIVFSITTGGQVQYTSPNFAGFSSLVMKYTIIENE